ncbi:DUF2147 domain-containing protein [Devosia sp.]|jgi:uncharacterized protein (DUF2147 family)|uniref:DUF2147 domain-containing protein n=1 Tax=Devosia sp. TaxID=1871048 RepID=UPI001ACB75C3|nr:DUF2147 domain-containing protein [Devosia sp.]MBN9334664.1 DUF2147 domain-containing protein [Devosia sp.]
MRFARSLAFAAAALLATPAFASPAGVWELEGKDTRFRLEMCGDGTQLCGQLIWLSDVDYNEQYKPYLNRSMANHMNQAGPNRWKGSIRLFGYNMSGTMIQRSEDHMTLQGCAVLVVCKTYEMHRYTE